MSYDASGRVILTYSVLRYSYCSVVHYILFVILLTVIIICFVVFHFFFMFIVFRFIYVCQFESFYVMHLYNACEPCYYIYTTVHYILYFIFSTKHQRRPEYVVFVFVVLNSTKSVVFVAGVARESRVL